jgi:ABC-type bacteriocin/lantibiotic exporter with double-glycine peptidase domain
MSIPCDNGHGKPALPPVREGIELRDINLRHERRGTPLFSGLFLTVKAGQCVAIRGGSGSGKSSLLSLINGLMHPDSGAIMIDGRPIQDFAADSIHREVAFLPQTSSIIAGTILENMTMYDRSLDHQALKIAHRLGLDQTVARMRLGYETPLGEGVSETLPEGVRQLITIVRALARNPSVILFDEANISLDMEGDKLLRDYLAEQKGKCTVVLVTPRPSLVSLADQVYTLADGRLVEAASESHQGSMAAADADGVTLPERPGRTEDLSVVVRRQFEEMSDFSTCLLPLLAAVNWTGNPKELAEAMPHLAQRLDLSGLCSILANLNDQPKHYASTLAHLDPRLMPCLFVPADRPAMVVLESRPNGHFRVFDKICSRIERRPAYSPARGWMKPDSSG